MHEDTYGVATKTAIILAAGESIRFNGVTKQLLSLGDETIIERTIRQCKQHRYVPIVFTANDLIIRASDLYKCYHQIPHKSDTVCDTVYHTNKFWGTRTAILLGDVIYSKSAMVRIMGCEADFMTFGNMWEVFALSFAGSNAAAVKSAIGRAIDTPPHKVRTIFMSYSFINRKMRQDKYMLSKIDTFDYIDDYTNDIDTLNDYKNFIIEIIDRNRLDDRKPK